jgi:hypothetical protein
MKEYPVERPPLTVLRDPEAVRTPDSSRVREDELAVLTDAERRYCIARIETEPARSLRESAQHLGISYGRSCARWSEIKAKLGRDPLSSALRPGGRPRQESELEQLARIAPGEFNRLLELRIDQLLRQMTEAKMERANVGELARAVRELGQQRQVIRSEPQRSLSPEERAALPAIMQALVREMARRGVEIDSKTTVPVTDKK